MKDVKDIRGIVMPILTPFKEDGELDEPMGCELARWTTKPLEPEHKGLLLGAMSKAGLSVVG